jgi:hypothetical protein
MTSAEPLAGPSVATILVLRVRRIIPPGGRFAGTTIHRPYCGGSTRMARKSFTLVSVGPVRTRSPSPEKKP